MDAGLILSIIALVFSLFTFIHEQLGDMGSGTVNKV